jgi:hypothetical protein
MLVALAIALGAALALLLYSRSKRVTSVVARDTTPALERFVREALEEELAGPVLGFTGSSAEERAKLRRTLADEPDADVVGRIEELVKGVDLEFVRYAHEPDAEVTVRVRFEDGKAAATTRRLTAGDVPAAVHSELEAKKTTRVFRSWAFPWQRVVAL